MTSSKIGIDIGIEPKHQHITDSERDHDSDCGIFNAGETETQTQTNVDLDTPWNVVVWDDPVNLMNYVVYVLQRVFGYNKSLATKLMLEVHNQGKSLVATEEREQAEHHAHQLHTYGLQATIRKAE